MKQVESSNLKEKESSDNTNKKLVQCKWKTDHSWTETLRLNSKLGNSLINSTV